MKHLSEISIPLAVQWLPAPEIPVKPRTTLATSRCPGTNRSRRSATHPRSGRRLLTLRSPRAGALLVIDSI